MKWILICIFLLVVLFVPMIASGEEVLGGLIKTFIFEKVFSLIGLAGGAAGIGTFILGKSIKDNRKIKTGLQETGEFFNALGSAMEDGKLSMKEVGAIMKEGKDVIDLFCKTPRKYKA